MHRSTRSMGALVLAGALLVGCATPDAGDSGQAAPLAPADAVAVTTGHPVTVLDDGSGAELCLGAVATSLPPQCGGPRLVGWDWSAHTGEHEGRSGVRWGIFVVTGHYDPTTDEFFVGTVASGADYQWPPRELPDFSTPCPVPAGGWQIVDPSMTTTEAMYATFDRAAKLDGYATAWLDQSPNPESETGEPDDVAMNDPLQVIVNVRVTGDPAAAEAELREGWGGMLCVTRADHTEGELVSILNEIAADGTGVVGGSPDGVTGVVKVDVVYDDGSLQRGVDDRFGEGLVRVTSALKPLT